MSSYVRCPNFAGLSVRPGRNHKLGVFESGQLWLREGAPVCPVENEQGKLCETGWLARSLSLFLSLSLSFLSFSFSLFISLSLSVCFA